MGLETAPVPGRVDLFRRLAAVLTWPAPTGSYRRLLNPLAAGTGVRAVIEAVIPETARSATVVMRPGAGWQPHVPGQWVSVGVEIDGARHHRCYSITSLPAGAMIAGSDLVTVTVQSVPDGIVSNHLVRDARPGDVVTLEGPQGDFTLGAFADPSEPTSDPTSPADLDRSAGTPTGAGGAAATTRTRPMMFVTGGSGLTPVMGMLRALDAGIVAEASLDDVVVLHHAPSAADSLFGDEIAAIARRRPGLSVHLVETGSGAPPPELELNGARLDDLCPDWRDRETWACGPRPLVDALGALWDDPEAGTTSVLHVERFTPATSASLGTVEGTLTFVSAGTSAGAAADATAVETDGTRTDMDLAESVGLTPLSGCRMGVCRRCVVPLRSGTVVDMRDGRTESEAGTHVQICIAAPVGDVEIEL